MNFVIHWNETSLSLHVFPIPIPPPTSLSTRSLQVLPKHQVRALVSCIPQLSDSRLLSQDTGEWTQVWFSKVCLYRFSTENTKLWSPARVVLETNPSLVCTGNKPSYSSLGCMWWNFMSNLFSKSPQSDMPKVI